MCHELKMIQINETAEKEERDRKKTAPDVRHQIIGDYRCVFRYEVIGYPFFEYFRVIEHG